MIQLGRGVSRLVSTQHIVYHHVTVTSLPGDSILMLHSCWCVVAQKCPPLSALSISSQVTLSVWTAVARWGPLWKQQTVGCGHRPLGMDARQSWVWPRWVEAWYPPSVTGCNLRRGWGIRGSVCAPLSTEVFQVLDFPASPYLCELAGRAVRRGGQVLWP